MFQDKTHNFIKYGRTGILHGHFLPLGKVRDICSKRAKSTYLGIASLNPLAIPPIVPKDALAIVRCVILTTVNAAGVMRAGGTCKSRGDGRVSLQITFATSCKGAEKYTP